MILNLRYVLATMTPLRYLGSLPSTPQDRPFGEWVNYSAYRYGNVVVYRPACSTRTLCRLGILGGACWVYTDCSCSHCRLAFCCTVLRSRWCQSGVNITQIFA